MGFATTTIDFCPTCCRACDLPDVMNATISGMESCGCVEQGGQHSIFDDPSALNITLTGIPKIPGSAMGTIKAFWRKDLGVATFTAYSGDGCTGTADPGEMVFYSLFILCLDFGDGPVISLQVLGSQSGYPPSPSPSYPDYIPVLNGGFFAIVTPGTPSANDVTCGDGISYIAEGTGQIDIP